MLPKSALACVLSAPLLAQGWVDRSTANGPTPRYGHAMCYDPVHGYTLMVGGNSSSGPFGGSWALDTWSWNGASWQSLAAAPYSVFSPSTSWPPANGPTCAMSFHAATGTVLLMAQPTLGVQPWTARCWAWNGVSWNTIGDTNLFVGFSGGSSPRGLWSAYDQVRQETILISQADPGRVAVWNGSTWGIRIPLVVPAYLYDVSLAWDSAVGRLALTGIGGGHARIYEWTGLSWTLRLPATLPSRTGVTTFDAAHQRIVMFDQDWDSFPGGFQPNHTWLVQNGQYTRLTTPVEPTLREGGALAFDTTRSVCVLFGGWNGNPMGDTWEFDLGPLASFTSYGTGCLGSRGVPTLTAQGTSLPRIGTTFTAYAGNLPWTGPAFLALGLSNTSYSGTPLPIDLGFLGAPGCSLRTSIDDIQSLVNVLGAATWSFQVPPVPGASFYAQVLPVDFGWNPLGLTASNGAHGVIGL